MKTSSIWLSIMVCPCLISSVLAMQSDQSPETLARELFGIARRIACCELRPVPEAVHVQGVGRSPDGTPTTHSPVHNTQSTTPPIVATQSRPDLTIDVKRLRGPVPRELPPHDSVFACSGKPCLWEPISPRPEYAVTLRVANFSGKWGYWTCKFRAGGKISILLPGFSYDFGVCDPLISTSGDEHALGFCAGPVIINQFSVALTWWQRYCDDRVQEITDHWHVGVKVLEKAGGDDIVVIDMQKLRDTLRQCLIANAADLSVTYDEEAEALIYAQTIKNPEQLSPRVVAASFRRILKWATTFVDMAPELNPDKV